MYQDNSAAGMKVTVISTVTIPAGITLEAWSTDTDPLVFSEQPTADVKPSLNGDMVVNKKPVLIKVTTNLIANSEDARILLMLYDAMRIAKNKAAVQEIVTMLISYPQSQIVLTNGILLSAAPGLSVGADGKYKDMKFEWAFENKSV